jgi:hypothetical protein
MNNPAAEKKVRIRNRTLCTGLRTVTTRKAETTATVARK